MDSSNPDMPDLDDDSVEIAEDDSEWGYSPEDLENQQLNDDEEASE